jgi:Tetratricopeptide repeat
VPARARVGAHPRLAVALNELGGARVYEGRFADAEPLFAEALAVARAALPDRHPDLAPLLGNLLECRLLAGAERDALALCREADTIDDGWWRRCWRSGRARCRWSSASAPSATWT